MTGQFNWFWGVIALGIVFLLAVWVVKPVDVSTQFVIFDGVGMERDITGLNQVRLRS